MREKEREKEGRKGGLNGEMNIKQTPRESNDNTETHKRRDGGNKNNTEG